MICIESLRLLSECDARVIAKHKKELLSLNEQFTKNCSNVENSYLMYKIIYIYTLFRFIQCYRYIPHQHRDVLFPRVLSFEQFLEKQKHSHNLLIYSRFNFIYNYFYFLDLVRRYHNDFTVNYAVKCLPDKNLVALLADTGGCFDCASPGEIDLVINKTSSEKIIYANCCKTKKAIEYSRTRNIKLTTFDNYEELIKMYQFNPDSDLLLRINVESFAKISLSSKFGMDLDDIVPLLESKHEHLRKIVGLCFHVGSDNNKPLPWLLAIQKILNIIKIFENYGYSLKIIDLGGGYNISYLKNIINSIFEVYQSELSGYRLIFEPGRCLVENVVSYMPSFEKCNDNIIIEQSILYSYFRDSILVNRVFPYFYGDNVDIIQDNEHISINSKRVITDFPKDILLFPNFGAYTISIACERYINVNKIYI